MQILIGSSEECSFLCEGYRVPRHCPGPDRSGKRQLVFDDVVRRSGNSTIRAIVKSELGRERLEACLVEQKCTWEIDSTTLLWAIDVPAEIRYRDLRGFLETLVDSGLVAVEEAYVSARHLAELDEAK